MTLHIALLRAVNLAGKRTVGMADLRALLSKLKLGNPRSLLNSGNLLFESDGRTTADLERLLEVETEKRLSMKTDFFVRTLEEWNGLIGENPFLDEAESAPARLHILVTKTTPSPAQMKALSGAIVGREVVKPGVRAVYAFYPEGVGESKLTNAVLAKHLGSPCTGRNWNTVLRLSKA